MFFLKQYHSFSVSFKSTGVEKSKNNEHGLLNDNQALALLQLACSFFMSKLGFSKVLVDPLKDLQDKDEVQRLQEHIQKFSQFNILTKKDID